MPVDTPLRTVMSVMEVGLLADQLKLTTASASAALEVEIPSRTLTRVITISFFISRMIPPRNESFKA
jgi:hypothetical protein